MKQFAVFAILVLCAVSGFSKNVGPKSFQPNDVISFFRGNFLVDSPDASASPAPSTACFDYYMNILNTISTATETANEECNQAYTENLAAADQFADDSFKQINSESLDLQNALITCSKEDTNDGLNCYESTGVQEMSSLSTISNGARSAISQYNQKVNNVKQDLANCNAEVSAQSEAYTQEVYSYLAACMGSDNHSTVVINPEITISTAAPTVPTTEKVVVTTAKATEAPAVKTTELTKAPEVETTAEKTTDNSVAKTTV